MPAARKPAHRPSQPPPKPCVSCGRDITWRKKWERDWDQVKYCSDACRRRGTGGVEAQLETAMLRLLHARRADATICPSEAARAVSPEDWQPLMEPARRAARRLVAAGLARVLQGGVEVDPSTAKGPIRVGLSERGRGAAGLAAARPMP